MRRFLLLLILAFAAFPAAANASVVSNVANGTLTVTGDAASDKLVLRPAQSTLELDVGADGTVDFAFDRSTFTKIVVKPGGGDDTVRIDGPLTEATTIDTGAGADVVMGGASAELISTGDDADLVLGRGGDDRVFLGAGDDTAIHGTGDGADTVEGQTGVDTLQESGSDESEEFTAQVVGTRLRLTRDTDPARAEMAGIETLGLDAGGGPDLVDVGDLALTEITRFELDLGLADGARDAVDVQGSAGGDKFQASAAGDTVVVGRPGHQVRIDNADDDQLAVFGFGGADTMTAIGSVGALIRLTLDGGDDSDTLNGGSNDEVLRGGAGDDSLRGNGGADTVQLGDGADRATWRLADGADSISGGAGEDSLNVLGTSADETMDISATGPRARVGDALLDGVEAITPAPGSGTDAVAVHDLTGTGVKVVDADLGAPDSRLDRLVVDGTPGADKIKVAASGADHVVTGLAATVRLITTDPGQVVAINGGDGDDEIDATLMTKDKTQPFLNGGAGKDVIVGSPGQDVITGAAGNDVALLAGGLDTFNWSSGDGNDIVEGGAGTDFLHMDGSAAADAIAVSPIGGRTRVVFNGAVVADMGGLERIDMLPGSGPDTVRVDDMSGTATDHVDLDLRAARGSVSLAADGSADALLVKGTNGNDAISVSAAGPEVRETGLAAIVTTRFSDPALDSFHIDTALGNDLVSVGTTVNQLINFSSS